MSFSYYDKDNNIKRLNIEVGKEWSSYKEKDENSLMNSVFDAVDQNSDGKVDENELNILQKLLKIADSQINKTKNNNVIEKEELELIVDKIKESELRNIKENSSPENITPKIINIPNDKDKLINYSYLSTFTDEYGNAKVYKVIVDFSILNNLPDGKYYIESWNYSDFENDTETVTPKIRKIQYSNQDRTLNWSEGINRNISKIQLNKYANSNIISFLNKVGDEQGFIVELLDNNAEWVEDYSIVRADKKQVIPETDLACDAYENKNKIITKRKHITRATQGSAFQSDEQNNGIPNAEKYSHVVSTNDIIQGKTYLEGGNVLNTLTKNGKPAVIIGEESLQYTILAMGLKDSPESRIKAQKQIAEELGIKKENVTFIPQFDFHIDMHYRPLNDGQIAIPDYEAGINVLKELIQDIETNNVQNNELLNKKEEYLKLINKLEEMKTKTAEISKEAEEELTRQGYEIVRVPSFTEIDKGDPVVRSVENPINYMNGICGTSSKTGDKFYITNTSGDEILDAYMEKYFKEVVGFDKIYFAPTKNYLKSSGGIDCLTKEF